MNKHISERPLPLTAHNKEITSDFNDLVLKMISKKPADRPSSLHEFVSKMSRIRVYKSDPAPTSARDANAF